VQPAQLAIKARRIHARSIAHLNAMRMAVST